MKALIFLPKRPHLGHQISIIPVIDTLKKKGYEILCIEPDGKSSFFLQKTNTLSKDEVIDSTKINSIRLLSRIRKFKPDVCINMRALSIKTDLLCLLSGSDIIHSLYLSGSKILKGKITTLDFSQYIGATYLKLLPFDYSIEQFYKNNPNKLNAEKKTVTLITAGTKDYKIYPLEKYHLLGVKLQKMGYTVQVLIGKGMQEQYDYFSTQNDLKLLDLKTLEQERDIIRESALVIANDCGPSHFAQIYDVPRISLFSKESPYPPEHWTIDSDNQTIIEGNKISDITIEVIIHSIK